MGAGEQPAVAVVVSTRDRSGRLEKLLRALRAQNLARERFEVVIVDNGSKDGTAAVLRREAERRTLPLKSVRLPPGRGPAFGRDRGWREARAELIAFTDDDCEPAPDWLATALSASRESPGGFIQGRTEPNPAELELVGPFTRTIEVTELDPNFPTCNMVYPRAVLERIGGFDTLTFDHFGGEDCDLAWRAIAAGAKPVFRDDLRVHHAVNHLGPLGTLRRAAKWSNAMAAYAIHPELRRAAFAGRYFWKHEHYLLARALAALLVPRRWSALRARLALPYARLLWARWRVLGGGPAVVPFHILYDLVETAGVLRAAVRHRVPML